MNRWRCLLITSEKIAEVSNTVAAGEIIGIELQVCPPDQAMIALKKRDNRYGIVMFVGDISKWSEKISLELIQLCEKQRSNIIVVSENEQDFISVNAKITSTEPRLCVVYGDINEPAEMIAGRMSNMLQMNHWHIHNRVEIERLKMVGQPLSDHFNEVTEEMHLASRLQRDFLPRELPKLPGIEFGTVYRPATWVSGDIYDVMRLDEKHFAFYLADAVGHGMPAALLTMFIKRAIVPKRIKGKSYELVPPGEILASLNQDMCQQGLSDQQFATCCYGIMNFHDMTIQLANAGHPYPLVMKGDKKTIDEFRVKGALLGVIEDAEYETKEFNLEMGDKLLVYSDGVEAAFDMSDVDLEGPPKFREEFDDLIELPVKSLVEKLLYQIDSEVGSLHPRDDVTVVGIEIL